MKKIIFKIFRNLFFLIGGIMLVFLFYANKQLEPISTEGIEVKVKIPMGSHLKEITTILEDEGVIQNKDLAYYYLRFKGQTQLQAGTYMLSPSMEVKEIAARLKEGKVFKESIQFTIPEGYNIEQIAERLEAEGLVNYDEFLNIVQTGDFSNINIVKEIPNINDRRYRLEGFLFPKTYTIEEGASVKDIISMMLKQTDKEISEEWLKEIKKQNKSLYEIMILASIVEEEAATKSEQAKIAGVYYNRLKIGMKLQADATIQYALPETKQRVLYSDLEIDSPYNTYQREGLTPSPIASPGIDAIKAAIYPEEHEFKFYVTKKDGSREHYFSKTFDEHKSSIDKSDEN